MSLIKRGYNNYLFMLSKENQSCPVNIGHLVSTRDNRKMLLLNATPPHKPSSTGRIYVMDDQKMEYEFFPPVCGLKWVRISEESLNNETTERKV